MKELTDFYQFYFTQLEEESCNLWKKKNFLKVLLILEATEGLTGEDEGKIKARLEEITFNV